MGRSVTENFNGTELIDAILKGEQLDFAACH